MTEVIASGIIDATAETVWAGLRDFSGPARWVRNIVTSDIEGNHAADQVGAIRRLVFDTGNSIRERLIALSDHDRYFRYTLLPTEGMPISDYSGKVQVLPVTDGQRAMVHWSGHFTISKGEPAEVCAWVKGIYQRDIEDMQAYFTKG